MNVEAGKTRLEEKLQSLSPERRALLARRLKAQGGGAQPRIQATARHGQDTFPLSFAQQRLWFLEQWAPGNPAYVQIFNLHLKGAPRPALLAEALRQLIQRHEALRTTFVTVDGQPAQRIHPQLAIDLPLTDLSQLPAEAGAAEAARMTLQEARKPFDLERGPLIRAQLLRLTAEEWRLLMTQHHIITDAGSLNLMLRELAAIYSALATGKPSPLAAPALQYVDFAQWQRNWLQGEALEKQMAYWRGKLQGLETIDLPLDHARPAMQRYLGIKRFVTLPPEIATSLRAMCQREGVTLYILTMAVFKVLLQRYTGLSSIVVGSPSANRERIETESIMGFFTNTLVMQTDVSGDPTFRELLKRVKETALEAYAHQDVPFEKLVEELHP
ncbi:MAG TPA: condensation domain-containing protein, partial [Phycisphaerae bacterium]|nr:condensation domain-containing protein [Phycisphaerae bacterium]